MDKLTLLLARTSHHGIWAVRFITRLLLKVTPKGVVFSCHSGNTATVGSAGSDKEYRQKVRSLSYNLSDASNPELRARVLQGEVAPDRLVHMTPTEMASKVCNCVISAGSIDTASQD